jgi:hypothetical protein
MSLSVRAAGWKEQQKAFGKDGFDMKNSKLLGIAFLVFAFLACSFPFGFALDEAQIQKKFATFEKEWINKLNEQGKYGKGSMQVEEGAGGGALFVAKYDVIKERAGSQIEKTDQPATPYVGVIRYEIWTCSAFGKTTEEAKSGKFECELKSQVREIFRFNGTEWVY